MSEPIGLIAGGGRLPVLEARGIRAAGREVVCVGLLGQYDDDLPGHCDRFAVSPVIRLNKWVRLLRRWGVREAVMVGLVRKERFMYDPLRMVRQLPDWRAAKLWFRTLRHDRRDQSMLTAVADELRRCGVTLIDTTRYIPEHLAGAGCMTRREPTAAQCADIDFGLPILLRMNELDVGQSIAIKECDVIAVEAIEGTDRMIERAGQLCRAGGWTLIKGPRPDKDMRFDVPTIGVQTIEKLKAGGAACLAVASGKVILTDKPAVLAAADKAGIAVYGYELPAQ
jgi:hypothetical protein